MTTQVEQLDSRRLLAAGDLLTSFGVGGRVLGRTTLPEQSTMGELYPVEALPRRNGSTFVVYRSVSLERASDPEPPQNITVACFRTDGGLDRSFGGGDGFAQYGFPGLAIRASAARLDDAGRILVLGTLYDPSDDSVGPPTQLGLLRVLPDGSLDPSFDADGRRVLDVQRYEFSTPGPALAVAPGGRIAIAFNTGFTFDQTETANAYRLRGDGTFDPTFDDDGIYTFPLQGTISDLLVQSDGKTVLAGGSNQVNAVLVYRLLPGGGKDLSFDGDGRRSVVVQAGVRHQTNHVTLDSAGRYLLVGRTTVYSYDTEQSFVIRLRHDGRGDSTFSGNGTLSTAEFLPPGTPVQVFDRAFPARDGSIFAATSNLLIDQQPSAIFRISSNGTVDEGFGVSGRRNLPTEVGRAKISARLSNGKFLTIGPLIDPKTSGFCGGSQLSRLNVSGTLDSGYTRGGLAVSRPGGFAATIDARGRLILGGVAASSFVVSAYKPDGGLDRSFGIGGYNAPAPEDADTNRLELLSFGDGRILLNGRGEESDSPDTVAVLPEWLQPDGLVDPRFPRPSSHYPGDDETSGGVVRIVDNRWTSLAWTGPTFHSRTNRLVTPDGRVIEIPFLRAMDVIQGSYDDRILSFDYSLPVRGGDEGFLAVGELGDASGSGGDKQPFSPPLIARFRADGTLDTSFDDDGVKFDFEGRPLSVQADGKIVFQSFAQQGLQRLNRDGSPDPTFAGGTGLAAPGGYRFAFDDAERIIAWRQLVGGSADGDVQVMRLTRDGRIDRSFGGGDGLIVVDTRLGSVGSTPSLLITPQQDMLVTSFLKAAEELRWSATKIHG